MYILIIIFLNSAITTTYSIDFSSAVTCEDAKTQLIASQKFKYIKNYMECVKK